MVLEISRVNRSSIESSLPIACPHKVQNQPQNASDVLCFNKEPGVFDKLITKTKESFFWLYEKGKKLFFNLISCFGIFQSAVNRQLQIFKENLPKVQELERQFPTQAKSLPDREMKKWWKTQFDGLDSEVQTMLLLEDIKMRKPVDIAEKAEKWAESNLEEYSTLATEFVVKLNKETINGDVYSPIDDLPDYLKGLRVTLEAKIKEIEAAQK